MGFQMVFTAYRNILSLMFKIDRLLMLRACLAKHLDWVLVLLFWFSAQAEASLRIDGTRLIYLGQYKEAGISVFNQSTQSSLLQSWISHEDELDTGSIPFAIIQPLVEVSSQERHLLRILYAGEGLPSERESLFWLNIMEIPRRPKNTDSVQFAIRQRLKIFYRPPSLQYLAPDAVKNLIWEIRDDKQIEVRNTSAFYFSLVNVNIESGGRPEKVSDYVLLEPGGTQLIDAHSAPLGADAKIVYTEINDSGLQVRHRKDLSFAF